MDHSLIELAEAAMARPAFQQGLLQLAKAFDRLLPPRQAMMNSMGSVLLMVGQAFAPREPINRLLDEAYQAAVSARQGPDEEPVAALADSVREFTSSQAGFIPRNMQKPAFVYFCRLLVLLALMQVSFHSETADAVIANTSEILPIAAAFMVAAAAAWDRYGRRPEDKDDADGQEDDED